MLKFVLDFINFMLEINKEWTEANRHRRRETLPHALWGCAVAGSLLSGCDSWEAASPERDAAPRVVGMCGGW